MIIFKINDTEGKAQSPAFFAPKTQRKLLILSELYLDFVKKND
jgi:hypothetical protein